MSLKSVIRGFLIRAIAVLVAVTLALVLAEILLRVTGYDPIYNPAGPRYMFVADEELGIRLRPGFEGTHRDAEFAVPVVINGQGFRDDEVGPKGEKTFRVLSLGDSFAFGYGVPAGACYASVLEDLLNEHTDGRTFEVINMGAPSYSMSQMAILLDRTIDELKPDLVISTVLIADDLRTNEDGALTERGGLVLSKPMARAIDADAQARFAVNSSEVALMYFKTKFEWEHGVELGAPKAIAPGLPRPAGLPYLAKRESEKAKKEWALAGRILSDIAKRCEAAGAKHVTFHVPLPHICDDDYWNRVLEEHADIDGSRFDRTRATKKLRAACKKAGSTLFDPSTETIPELRLVAADFFPGNLHFNHTGHGKVGAMLARFLATEKLL